MKSKILRDEMKELPLKEFLLRFPDYKNFFLSQHIDINDTNYIVRYSRNGVEIGYADDEWVFTKNGFDKRIYKKLETDPNAIQGIMVKVIETPLSNFLTKETGYFGADVPKIYREAFCKAGVNYKQDFINHGIDVDDEALLVRCCIQLNIIEIGYENDEWVLGTQEKGFRGDLLPPISELDINAPYILLRAKSSL